MLRSVVGHIYYVSRFALGCLADPWLTLGWLLAPLGSLRCQANGVDPDKLSNFNNCGYIAKTQPRANQ